MLRQLAADALYDAKTSLARYPAVAMPLQRLRGRGELVDDRHRGGDRGVPAVRLVVRRRGVPARAGAEPHAHRPSHAHARPGASSRVRRGLPTMVLAARPALDAVVSHLIRSPDLGAEPRCVATCASTNPSCPCAVRFVTATFDEVVGDRSASRSSASTPGSPRAFAVRAHAGERGSHRGRDRARLPRARGLGDRLEAVIPRPSASREAIKAEVRERVRREVSPRMLAEAHAVYRARCPAPERRRVAAQPNEISASNMPLGASSTKVVPGFSAISSPDFVTEGREPRHVGALPLADDQLAVAEHPRLALADQVDLGRGIPRRRPRTRSRSSSRPGSRRCRP